MARPSPSIRTVLVAGTLAVALVPPALIGAVGVASLTRSVRGEALSRVSQDLEVVRAGYEDQLGHIAAALEVSAARLRWRERPAEELAGLRRELGLTVLNLCDAEGRPLAGSHAPGTSAVPFGQDPVLRLALQGRPARGTVRLEPERLLLEGGPALQQAAVVTGGDGRPVERSALAWWLAVPLQDAGGRVEALLYGGRLLTYDEALVDRLRDAVFSQASAAGQPGGTVTLFAGDLRVATNVPGPQGARAVGTRVSEPVRQAVLEQGQRYVGEALVVDRWYLSAYSPLRDPSGRVVGMLYVGLPRAPYDEQRRQLVARFLLPVGLVAVLAVGVALLIVNRITRPLGALRDSAAALAQGDWEHSLELPRSYAELESLARSYADMRQAIQRRDQELRARNEELTSANEQLELSNRNYMQTLAFVTHELKAPLAAMQTLIGTLLDGYLGALPEKVGGLLVRIQRNCEELQDMVRDYLDLSRLERGELAASKSPIDLARDVVAVSVDHTAVFFRSRRIELSVACPEALPVVADPGLLRIALNNFLTNAAKYGREEGQARLSVHEEDGWVTLGLWNEGPGFPREAAEKLFDKFYRVRDASTHAKRGSGIGLFTVRTIAELHGGRAWAESEPGAWAAFHLRFPARPPAEAAVGTPVSAPAGS